MNQYTKYDDFLLGVYFLNLKKGFDNSHLGALKEVYFNEFKEAYLKEITNNNQFKLLVLDNLKNASKNTLAYIDYIMNLDEEEIEKLNFIKRDRDDDRNLNKVKENLKEIKQKMVDFFKDSNIVGILKLVHNNKLNVYSEKVMEIVLEDPTISNIIRDIEKITEKNNREPKLLNDFLTVLMLFEKIHKEKYIPQRTNLIRACQSIHNEVENNLAIVSEIKKKDGGKVLEYNLNELSKISIAAMDESLNMPNIIDDKDEAFMFFRKLLKIIDSNKEEKIFLVKKINHILEKNRISRSAGVLFYNSINHINKEGFIEDLILNKLNSENIREKMDAFEYARVLSVAGSTINIKEFVDEVLNNYAHGDLKNFKNDIVNNSKFKFLFNLDAYRRENLITNDEYKWLKDDLLFKNLGFYVIKKAKMLESSFYRNEVLKGNIDFQVDAKEKNTLTLDKEDFNRLLNKEMADGYILGNIKISKSIDTFFQIALKENIDVFVLDKREKQVLLIYIAEFVNDMMEKETSMLNPEDKYRELILLKDLGTNNDSNVNKKKKI